MVPRLASRRPFLSWSLVQDAFEGQRGRLFGLAYRMLGSAADAEDVLQEAHLRWTSAEPGRIAEPAAWLTRVVTNLCLNQLTSARARRERYVGLWLPEPVLTADGALGPLDTYERRESVSFGMLLLLERLTPAERAVFVLREAFGYPYRDIAGLLGHTEDSCRQLHRRALRHVGGQERFDADPEAATQLFTAFLAAAERGDVGELERVLAADVTYRSDGGGKVPAARHPVTGGERVARLLAGVLHRFGGGMDVARAEVNGLPGVVGSMDGRVVGVLAAHAAGGRIGDLWMCANPDKLTFLAAQTGTLSHPGWRPGLTLHDDHDPGDRRHRHPRPGGRTETARGRG